MTKPLISILIPFYNEENFISRSLNSAINQTYENIEIIVIDDYSIDNSVEIVKQMMINHPNISLLKSKNKGVGSARNTGIECVQGEYFTFLDADDELDSRFVEVCYEKVKKHSCDIVVTNTQVFDVNLTPISKFNLSFEDKLFTNQTGLLKMYQHQIIPSPWGKLIKTDLLSEFIFPERIYFEDKPFVTSVLLDASSTCVLSEKLYFNYSHNQSITRRTIQEVIIKDSTTSFFIELTIIDAKSKSELSDNFVKNSFQYQLQIMRDLFLIINIDRAKIDFQSMKYTFVNCLKKIATEIKKRKIKLSLKNRILLIFMLNGKYMGFIFPYLILKTYYGKQLQFIKKIKE
ncbi:MAG: glycosyltransferase family 2 protein [Flavobacteriales bacterium]